MRVFIIVLLLLSASPAKMIKPTIGISIDRIYGVDTKGNSFKTIFWLWSVSSVDENYTMDSIEFVNGLSVTKLQRYVEIKGNKVWTSEKIKGEFAIRWDLRKYPFDVQNLKIIIEDGNYNCKELSFQVDANSILNQSLYVNNWRLKGMLKDKIECHILYTSYGDPSLNEYSTSKYSRLIYSIEIERGVLREGMTVLLPIGLAFLIAWLGFLVYRDYGIKTTLFLSSLFLLLGVKSAVDSSLHVEGMTLVDYYILFTFIGIIFYLITILLSMYVKNDNTVKKINSISMFYTMVVYILCNTWITLWFLKH